MVGLVLVLDLWAGLSGSILALLALGLRVIAIAAESNEDACAVALANLPGLIHIEWVEEVRASDVSRVLERRSFLAVLVGGGSPCQGNSTLNRKRKNLNDERSCQPLLLRALYDEICALKVVVERAITVLCWLENVASAQPETKRQYSDWLQASYVLIRAQCFGWIDRNRCFWGRSQTRTLAEANWSSVPQAVIVNADGAEPELRYSGAKPIPRAPSMEDGYVLGIDPRLVMKGEQPPLYPFTREFWHPRDPGVEARVSAAALDRWEKDHRRFPAGAYEANHLAWRDNSWRTPSPRERASIHGFPTRVVDAVPTKGRSRDQVVAIQNSLIGNGFHLPSVMLFFCALLSLVDKSAARQVDIEHRMSYGPAEAALRSRIRGSVFEPGLFLHYPGLIDGPSLVEDIARQVAAADIAPEVWSEVADNISHDDLASLQSYWVDTQLRCRSASPQGPEWSAQASRSMLPASLGTQRYPGNSRRGLDHLIQPGLGKEGHLKVALTVKSPFRPGQAIDDDIRFAARALALMGPYLTEWKRKQERAFGRLCKALAPASAAVEAALSPAISTVAGPKRPVVMAALTSLMRWPDRSQAECFIKGFRAFGTIPEANVFRELPRAHDDPATLDPAFWGPAATAALHELLRSRPPKEAAKIFDATKAEIQKGWLGPCMDAKDLNRKYGVGQWRFIPRFLLQQRDKERLIDDALRGGQNGNTHTCETIYTLTVDWLGEVLSAMCLAIASEWGDLGPEASTAAVLEVLPEWFQPVLGVDDLPDAYRGCPIHPDDQRGCIVAYWDPARQKWSFSESRAMLFGLSAAVLGFNRLPTLASAAMRRLFAVCAGAYFDDIASVGCACHNGLGQRIVGTVLRALGAPVAPEKSLPMAQHRVWLGVAANLASIVTTGELLVRPKDAAVSQVVNGIGGAYREGALGKSAAAKLRGQSNWTGSFTAGKCGRIGLEVLKVKQYVGPPALDHHDKEALLFLAAVTLAQPERSSLVAGAREAPALLYTDASHEPEQGQPPRMGWVLFCKGQTPIGGTVDIPLEVISSWMDRKTQIFAAEAFAPYAAIWNLRALLKGRDLVVFIDNEGAASAQIRGSSKVDDVGSIVQSTHWLLLELQCRMWVEWIDSNSNLSDGLSRDGLLDEWTLRQSWSLSRGCVPPWRNDLKQQLVSCSRTLGLV